MTGVFGELPATGTPAAAGTGLSVPDALLLDAVEALAGARTEADVATAVLPLLLGRHPAPLVVLDGRGVGVEVDPGPPLALHDDILTDLAETDVALPAGAALLLHTDGLTERRTPTHVALLDPHVLAYGLPDDPEQAADAVLTAAGLVGPAHDDVTLLLARPRG